MSRSSGGSKRPPNEIRDRRVRGSSAPLLLPSQPVGRVLRGSRRGPDGGRAQPSPTISLAMTKRGLIIFVAPCTRNSTSLAAIIGYRTTSTAPSSPSRTRSNSCTSTTADHTRGGFIDTDNGKRAEEHPAPGARVTDRRSSHPAGMPRDRVRGNRPLVLHAIRTGNQAMDLIINFFPDDPAPSC